MLSLFVRVWLIFNVYSYDLNFLKTYTHPIELKNGMARVIISPGYQGRVMTSSDGGENGLSFGWINHELIASAKTLKQINPVGGEERFWFGPEGGQFSIFFKPFRRNGKGTEQALSTNL